MIKVDFASQVQQWTKELEKFRTNLQNNINIGGLRVASNVVKDYMHAVPFVQEGKKGTYLKHLKKTRIGIKKRRRTNTGWERFKIYIKREDDDPQERNKSWYYNIITNSQQEERFADGKKGKFIRRINKKTDSEYTRSELRKSIGAKSRGILKKDPFMQRATKIARNKALSGYVYYVRARILADGAKISAKTINNAKRNGF